ncbi:hypothetical protein [Caloranaerobacter azorensis]|uniref:Lipoprotein n=1 Tax=Caloranaerobacter azorensis TaxID=116090 RepID=A0A6P1YDJ7_9FIRM|nr:hypothetical protein [Caloranaerobacter azorensis]QIB27002.1 hypothetical protein G3A45_06670 [Caloranaerobacter azorensis]
MIKKNIYVFLMILPCIFMLVGCDNYTKLMFKGDIDYIKIQIGERYKEITNPKDINNLISLIEESNLRKIKEKQNVIYYKIDIFIHTKTKYNKITVIKDIIFYNGNYYKSESNLGKQIEKIYLDMNYPELIDKNEAKKIRNKRINRRNLSLQKALEGYWIDSKGNSLYFKDGWLYQGKYEFRYHINSIDRNRNYIHISVFGVKSFFLKGKKLFDMHITIDDTKNNLKLEKDMVGGYRYNYNMIYIDDENYKLGTFEYKFFNH